MPLVFDYLKRTNKRELESCPLDTIVIPLITVLKYVFIVEKEQNDGSKNDHFTDMQE